MLRMHLCDPCSGPPKNQLDSKETPLLIGQSAPADEDLRNSFR